MEGTSDALRRAQVSLLAYLRVKCRDGNLL